MTSAEVDVNSVAFLKATNKAKLLARRYKRMRPIPGYDSQDIFQECMLCYIQGKTMEYGLIDIYRKNRLAQECEVHGIVTDWIADSSPTAAMTEYASELDLDKVKAAVEEIKDDRIRYVIEAHYFAGLSFENISIIMDCPRSTAHFLKDQGLKILRDRFGG
jgi:hypothetical protein